MFLAYFVAGKLGQATTNIRSGNLGPVWPAFGIALAAVLGYGYRIWPAVAAAAFLIAFRSPVPALTAVGQAAGATLAVVAGTYLLRRDAKFDPELSRLRDAVRFILLGGFGSALLSATIGVASLYLAGLPYSGLATSWLIYWLGDATGALLVTPLVFTLPALFGVGARNRILELSLLLTLLAITCAVIFGDLPLFPIRLHVLALGVLPFIMWSAVSFGSAGASLTVILVATAATVLTALGSGPFAQHTAFINAALLDVLFTVLAVSGLAFAAVITERERAEVDRENMIRAQTAMESRLRLAAIVDSLNDAVISITLDGRILSWNAAARRMFGFTSGEVHEQPIVMLLAPEARSHADAALQRLSAGFHIEPFETVCITKSGNRMRVAVSLFPLKDVHGKLLGGATIIRDITQEKQAEEVLSSVSQRLIEAQEQERARIARELHDDIGQRLSLLAVNLTGLRNIAAAHPKLYSHASELHRQSEEIAKDVQALSHRLHSSKLELLGITASMRLLCEEVGSQHRVSVDFTGHDVPGRVPPDIALCLFRILQEALHNAAKHSGARHFDVQLRATADRIHLVVQDLGRGFDVAAARLGRGIGLVSMHERAKLVGGQLSIESHPQRGTTVYVHVPALTHPSGSHPSGSHPSG